MFIGTKVRELRKTQNISMTDLSSKSGVQLATLSRIENLKMTGTLESHISIAKALGIELTELYTNIDREGEKIEVKTSESSTDVFTHNEKSSYEILANNILSKQMMPILLKVDPSGRTTAEQNQPGSESFVFVLEGNVTVYIEEDSFPLSRYSSLYFKSSAKHYFTNDGKTTAKVLCVRTPVAL